MKYLNLISVLVLAACGIGGGEVSYLNDYGEPFDNEPKSQPYAIPITIQDEVFDFIPGVTPCGYNNMDIAGCVNNSFYQMIHKMGYYDLFQGITLPEFWMSNYINLIYAIMLTELPHDERIATLLAIDSLYAQLISNEISENEFIEQSSEYIKAINPFWGQNNSSGGEL
ncbi:MAG: hypothetical protein FWF59_11665 [Turicibacter sp.]|nr:hypothetical protein [Turicibacter sp.]